MNVEPQNSNPSSLDWWCAMQSCAGMKASDRRNYSRFTYWALAWAVSFSAFHVMLEEVFTQKAMIAVLILIPIVIAFFALRAYGYFYRQADELTQKIHLEGIKAGFCVGLFVLPPIWQFAQVGGPSLEMFGFAAMVLAYSVGLVRAARRYR